MERLRYFLTNTPKDSIVRLGSVKYYQIPSGALMRESVIRKKRYFTATEVATSLGISKQTLLRYEARGVFPKAHRNHLNRWREYMEADIQRLRKIMGR